MLQTDEDGLPEAGRSECNFAAVCTSPESEGALFVLWGACRVGGSAAWAECA